jgi:hypothetical protein
MSLTKVNRNKLFPWTNNGLKTFFNVDDFFLTLLFLKMMDYFQQ